jgi:hypothetical protein
MNTRWALERPQFEDLITLLRAWRFWLTSVLMGAAIGGLVFYVFPPQYRARASALVDFHMEQAWPQNTDREQFYYLERETRKLEALAWSDAVLQDVAGRVPGVSLAEMRTGKLVLSQPGNGPWHFYAYDRNAAQAASLAGSWSQAFASHVSAAVASGTFAELESFITVEATETQGLSAARSPAFSTYALAGALVVPALSFLFSLFVWSRE